MPTSLRDFLDEKATNQQQRERLERRREWVAAVDRLMAQLRAWLNDADTKQLLSIYTTEYSGAEKGLGPYKTTGLDIEFEDTHIKVMPVGRNVLRSGDLGSPQTRALGRVDITNGGMKFYVFRYLIDGADRWVAVDFDGKVTPLDRETFDKIMLELLS